MGTWGTGPFGNDDAADFASNLDQLQPAQRIELIRRTLAAVAAPDGETSSWIADPAIAAAALVAAQQPGGPPIDPIYGPEKPVPPLPPDLTPTAIMVLDRVVADDSEVEALWAETPSYHAWRDEIARIRAVLASSTATG